MTAPGAGIAPAPRRRWLRALAVAAVLVVAFGAAFWLRGAWVARGFTEYRMLARTDIPTAVAIGPDGTVWFTIEFSDAIGILRNGRIERIHKGKPNFEPLGLAVDAGGTAWYTDGPQRMVGRVTPDGAITAFALSTPVVKLAGLAIAPDGAVWFAEETAFSLTRLKDGVFTPHEVGSLGAAPFGVAVGPDGTVWGTIPAANRLVRLPPLGPRPSWRCRPGAVSRATSPWIPAAPCGSWRCARTRSGATLTGASASFRSLACPRDSRPSPSRPTAPCGSPSSGPIVSADSVTGW